MTASGDDWARFENPAHDFPKRVEYRRTPDGLHAEIAGPGKGGKELVIPFDYYPAACNVSYAARRAGRTSSASVLRSSVIFGGLLSTRSTCSG